MVLVNISMGEASVDKGLRKYGHSMLLLIRRFNYKHTFQTRFMTSMKEENYHKCYQHNESKDPTSILTVSVGILIISATNQ